MINGIKLTRHNGRYGKDGVFNPRHNDRNFNVENSEHIDKERIKNNVDWDYLQGVRFHDSKETDLTGLKFSEVEEAFYVDRYYDFCQAQNERNEKTRHPERNRTPKDILNNKKTCPEETIYQLGNIDGSVSGETLAIIAAEFFDEFQEKYGEYIHILDWAVHFDETTPHIHERHVFDAKNQYGEICPQQDEALKQLGFDLPNPNKKQGKHNNRKMTFDKVCRERFIEICHAHDVYPDLDPVYGGKEYLEKQEYILKKTKEEIAGLETKLATVNEKIEESEKKLSDADALIDEISEVAYKKAVDVVSEDVVKKTRDEDVAVIDNQIAWLSEDVRTDPKEKRDYAIRKISKIKSNILGLVTGAANRIKEYLLLPKIQKENIKVISTETKESFKNQLAKAKEEMKIINQSTISINKEKKKQQGIDDDD